MAAKPSSTFSVYKVFAIVTGCCLFFGVTRFLADNLQLLPPAMIVVFFIGVLLFPQLLESAQAGKRLSRGCCMYPILLLAICLIYSVFVIQLNRLIHSA